MRALTFHGKGDIRCESRPDPTPPDANGAVLRVERAAICGSDLHLYHGDLPVPETGFAVGHEFVGEVVEVGSAVRDFRAGDRVLCAGVIGCGLCAACRAGHVVRCERRQTRVFGMSGALPGGQAEAVAVPGADARAAPHPGRRLRRAGRAADRHPAHRLLRREERRDPAGPDGRGDRPRPRRASSPSSARQLFGAARVLAIDRIPERLAAAAALGAVPVARRPGRRDGPGARPAARPGRGDRGRRRRRHRSSSRSSWCARRAWSRWSASTCTSTSRSRWRSR